MSRRSEKGDVVLLENVRFNSGEKKDNEDLAKRYADLCDVFVMDAFDYGSQGPRHPLTVWQSLPRSPVPVYCCQMNWIIFREHWPIPHGRWLPLSAGPKSQPN